jgi:twitching motility protein PilI
MARAKLDLRAFQQELATRLVSKTVAQVESSRLGFASGGEQWLVRLADVGEVIAVPPLASVPHTQAWFLGVANIRGNLYSVVDLAGFLDREATVLAPQNRLVLFGARTGDLRAGFVVQSVLGLRNVGALAPAPPRVGAPAWHGQRWVDADHGAWQEIDLTRLARDPAFLCVGA